MSWSLLISRRSEERVDQRLGIKALIYVVQISNMYSTYTITSSYHPDKPAVDRNKWHWSLHKMSQDKVNASN